MKEKLWTLLVGGLFLAACSTVPITGRRQLSLVSDGEMNAMADTSYKDLIKQSKLSQDAEATARVRRAGERIAQVTDRKDFQWEFNLIDDPKMVNAFCMPGGKVAFYTGIMPICQTETGVAVVMGHEVAHAIAKHGAERMSQGLVAQLGMATLDVAMREKPEQTRSLVLQAVGAGASIGVILPFSRKQESEADRIGLIYMARAGYDPREAVAFWERMSAKSSGGQPPQFLSTHPSHDTRIEDLRKWMPEALAEYEKSKAR